MSFQWNARGKQQLPVNVEENCESGIHSGAGMAAAFEPVSRDPVANELVRTLMEEAKKRPKSPVAA